MKLSTRSRYGMRAIFELAKEYGQGPLQIKTIAEREGISNKYLEQLVSILKSAGLVRSIRGPKGGYILAKPPEDINLKDVFSVLEGPLNTVECLDDERYCKRCPECVTRDIWMEVQNSITSVLEANTLKDLVDRCKYKSCQATYQI